MSMVRLAIRMLPAMASAMLVLAAPAVVRAEMMDEEFRSYHRMVHAAAVCEHPGIDIRDHADIATVEEKVAADRAQERIAAIIEERVGADLSAGDKLFSISSARDEVREMIRRHGCDGTEITDLVRAYDEQIGVMP